MLEKGQIVKSIAGHDKNKFYIVVEEHEDSVKIADGKGRKLEKPKLKNLLHVRKTNTILAINQYATDKQLRKALAEFRGLREEEGGN